MNSSNKMCKDLLIKPETLDNALTVEIVHLLRKELEDLSTARSDRLIGLIMDLNEVNRPTICFRIIVHLLYLIASMLAAVQEPANQRNVSIATCKVLIVVNGCPDSLSVRDDQGNIALHHACLLNSPRAIIESFVSLKPNSPCVLNIYKLSCVHAMLENRFSVDTLEFIVKRCPDCLYKGNDMGKLPIHSLIARHSDDRVSPEVLSKALAIFIDLDPELLFCEFRNETYSVQFSSVGDSQMEHRTDVWSPLSKASENGNDWLGDAIRGLLTKAALFRSFGPVI